MTRGNSGAQLAELKRKQRRLEARINELIRKAKIALEGANREELDSIVAPLESSTTRWRETNEELNGLTPADQRDDEENRQDDLEDEILNCQRKIERALESDSDDESDQQEVPDYSLCVPAVPKLKFTTFSGEYGDWLRWWNHFNATVHQNKRLHPIDKFNLLKSYAGNRANDSISDLDVTVENYQKAVDILQKRFERLDLIQDEHLAAIAALPPVEDNKDGDGLRMLYDKLIAHTTSLESAGLDQSVFAPTIRPSMVRKLPFELQTEWRRMERNAACTFNDFLEFLEEAADVREFAARSSSKSSTSAPDKKSKVPATSAATTTVSQLAAPVQQAKDAGRPKRKCLFCGATHSVVKCTVSREKKIEQIKRERRCNRCLGTNHLAAACSKAQPCRKCNEPHHTALCPGVKTPAPAPAPSSAPATGATPVTNATATTLSVSAPIFGDISLKTATVMIDGPNGVRRAIAFVDDGSHRSYVRRSLAEELGLPIECQEDLSIGRFGSNTHDPSEVLNRRRITIRGTFPEAPSISLRVLDKEAISTRQPALERGAATRRRQVPCRQTIAGRG